MDEIVISPHKYVRVDSDNNVLLGFFDFQEEPADGDIDLGGSNEFIFTVNGVPVTSWTPFHGIYPYVYGDGVEENPLYSQTIDEYEREQYNKREIERLKSALNKSDYNIIKFAEKLLDCEDETELLDYISESKADLQDVVRERVSQRERINELENE